MPSYGSLRFWTSASLWAAPAPANKYVWCPSGDYLPPNSDYVNPGVHTLGKEVVIVVLNNASGVVTTKYLDDKLTTTFDNTMCELP